MIYLPKNTKSLQLTYTRKQIIQRTNWNKFSKSSKEFLLDDGEVHIIESNGDKVKL